MASGFQGHASQQCGHRQRTFVFPVHRAGAADLPNRCCTLSLSPLVRELIIEMADQSAAATADLELMETLLLSALSRMPVEHLHLPLTDEPRLARIASELADDPSNRSTMAQWAKRVAMVRIRSPVSFKAKRALPSAAGDNNCR